jgi:S-adenosylmethionine/arginine decarboxylase-like enzyme
MKKYGKSLLLDIHNADIKFFNRRSLLKFFHTLCKEIDMQPEKLVWWDDVGVKKEFRQTESHTKGTSAVQFILTSSIVIHTKDILKSINIDIFSCKNYDVRKTKKFCRDYFKGKIINSIIVPRY